MSWSRFDVLGVIGSLEMWKCLENARDVYPGTWIQLWSSTLYMHFLLGYLRRDRNHVKDKDLDYFGIRTYCWKKLRGEISRTENLTGVTQSVTSLFLSCASVPYLENHGQVQIPPINGVFRGGQCNPWRKVAPLTPPQPQGSGAPFWRTSHRTSPPKKFPRAQRRVSNRQQ